MTPAERTVDEGMDRQLIEGLRNNDRACLARIYDTYSGVAYALAVQAMGSILDAEDVVQESFIALWRQAERLDPERGIRSYLLTIVHHKAVDRLRQRGRRRETVLDLDLPLAAPNSNPEETATIQADREDVRQALLSLPLEQRLTIEMAYFNGLMLGEVASRIQVPLGTVKSRLRLAMAHLRKRLTET